MSTWFEETIVATGRLPLFAFFVSVIAGFIVARIATRLVRARVRWSPRNVKVGNVHVHHVVFGVIMMVLGGVIGLAVPVEQGGWRTAAAALFGFGTAAVLDEFALVLRLEDVYWSEQGRVSVDAVFVAIAMTGLILIGVRPAGFDEFVRAVGQGGVDAWAVAVGLTVVNLSLAVVTLLKGKVGTGLFGVFFWPLLVMGAWRLARPGSPWARWRYHGGGPRAGRKLGRATERELCVRRRIRSAFTKATDLIAGAPDSRGYDDRPGDTERLPGDDEDQGSPVPRPGMSFN